MSWYDIDPADEAALYRSWQENEAKKTGAAPGFDIFGMPLAPPAPAPAPAYEAPAAPAPASAAPAGPTDAQRDAFVRVKEVLASYGLDSLSDFVWTQIIEGRSEAEITQALRERPEYAARFPGMELRKKAGLPPISAGEYVSYERSAAALMREAGMPAGFWDTPADFADMIGRNVSIEQLNARLRDGYTRVAMAAPEVRKAFASYFGADGDAALAAYFLDPGKAMPFLEQAVLAAEIGGVGSRFGYRFSHGRATQLAHAGVTAASAAAGLRTLDERRSLFDETITEGIDYTAEGIGIDATFGLSPDAAFALERRATERAARFGGGGGGSASGAGITGLGSAT